MRLPAGEITVKMRLFAAASALALASLPASAIAQHQHMPGMQMPAPKPAATKAAPLKKKIVKKAVPKKVASKKAAPKKAASKKAPAKASTPAAKKAAAEVPAAAVEPVVDHRAMQHTPPTAGSPAQADHSAMGHELTPEAAPMVAAPAPVDHSAMGHAAPAEPGHTGHGTMTGAFGPYPMERESSGTAWQPDHSEHSGLMTTSGEWTLMSHGVLNLVYDHQGGRRGDDKAFASGMLMGMARRPIGNGTLQFKAMVSPDPLMGKSGYPLLLASGETANGTDRLIDRQHPHDFFIELSASASQAIGANSSVFIYAGLPAEPAFGPPAFMHREAILDSPEAPISHHWLDSTHISFGVLTGGVVFDKLKLEISRFNGREPDEHRWNIETGALDSTAVRLSWNPTAHLSLQGSWGDFKDPEQLEPGIDQKRWSASLLYAREVAPGWKLAGTLAWGRKVVEWHKDDAFVAEAGLKHGGWSVFARGERTENRELLQLGEDDHGPAFRVAKVSLGALRDFRIAEHFSFGAGGLVSLNFIPRGLRDEYGGRNPLGAMAFVRLKLD
jgi:hypothetical protein